MTAPLAYALVVVGALTACTLRAPDPPDFGVRIDGGEVVVAYPICPGESVSGALVSVNVDGDGRGDGFETLWSASGPASPEVRGGVFGVGSERSFRDEEKALVRLLPDSFFVETTVVRDGRTEEGDDGAIDLAKVRGKRLADGQYVTWEGKALTPDQINAQRECDGDSRAQAER
ncbi:hypothetical protein [Streptomyces sp. NBC_00467]|uniref:hypothetical protein n=1 Tax=Streptomyces sp. NBC_00467 TaxID=2975752 RepID=UPI002E17DD85